jgi:menaquinone-dependent protoporphyrinogen IX oxidase
MKTILLISSIILLSGCTSRYEYKDKMSVNDIFKMAGVNTDENKTDTFKWIPFENK